ncbi:MAG TPA: hypothetical protein VE996_15170 [Terriglobales bacterium]|jgi:hypothetical protein|nr:hypothetical protein [Terriglobales bacterium]
MIKFFAGLCIVIVTLWIARGTDSAVVQIGCGALGLLGVLAVEACDESAWTGRD